MASVCFYFQVHQPCRLMPYTIFDSHAHYFDDFKNAGICRKTASTCYLPANRLMLDLIGKYQGRFRISYSITGIFLEQLESFAPEVLDGFRELAATGCVEFLAETYYHSLSSLYSPKEFVEQVQMHKDAIYRHFGQVPRVFRNTELIYNNSHAEMIENIGGFHAILAEGADSVLGCRSPNFVYRPAPCKQLKLLLRNYRLSDDIALRFSNKSWDQWPLDAQKFVYWIHCINEDENIINLFMDYETLGGLQGKETGIFDFIRFLPAEILRQKDNYFKTPSEIVSDYEAVDSIDVPLPLCWGPGGRDLSAWQGNPMQRNACVELYRLEQKIKNTNDDALIRDWRIMQVSDHISSMDTKSCTDGDVHKYSNLNESPYDTYINFMNIMGNMNDRCADSAHELQTDFAAPQNCKIP